MDILIFDMDGVLLDARGYHRALQKTVKLAAESLSLDNIELSQDAIHHFESLGISSEWHSSALCMAFLEIQLQADSGSPSLDLTELFAAIQGQPLDLPARQRGYQALKQVCAAYNLPADRALSRISESEDIDRSPTMNWFQELVLGSQAYQDRYHKEPGLDVQSYLETYDLPLLLPKHAGRINNWQRIGGLGAGIMTNRPSSGPPGFSGSPEAELGRDLVKVDGIPLIGYGEISWLASHLDCEPGELAKPNPSHALSAILLALGLPKETSLCASLGEFSNLDQTQLRKLQTKTITVFEDTPAGIRSIRAAGEILQKAGIQVSINPIGIAASQVKHTALEAEGARVFSDINSALSSLDNL